jgi:D-galacturonate reductase
MSPTTRPVCCGTTRKCDGHTLLKVLTGNSFYMKYAPDEEGNFAGQTGYGYISFEKFIDAVTGLNEGKLTLEQLDARPLPTLKNTIATTAILEAGRRSLDENRPIEIVEENGVWSLK